MLGQVYDSFILAAGSDGLWIIDQHVAHERILFERNLARQAAGKVEQQRLLMPIVLPLTPAQQVEYDRIAADLATAGFETEPFGNRTIAVKAVPADLEPGGVESAIYEILEIAESELRRVSVNDCAAASRPRWPAARPSRSTRRLTGPKWRPAAGTGPHRLPDVLSPWPPRRAALLHARHPAQFPSHLGRARFTASADKNGTDRPDRTMTSKALLFHSLAAVCVLVGTAFAQSPKHAFAIDGERFLLDGKPLQIRSGSCTTRACRANIGTTACRRCGLLG